MYDNIMSNNKVQPLVINNKSCKRYFILENKKVYFNADFDSGNIESVEQLGPYIYKLRPGYDKTRDTTEKTFFHFKVCGFEMCTVRFHITRVHILQKLLRTNQVHVYKPVVRHGKGNFQLLKKNVKIYYNGEDNVELSFEYEFEQTNNEWIQFAFTFPYPYEDCQNLIKEFRLKYVNHEDIYFHDEVLTYTKEKRKLQLLTITERRNCEKVREDYVEGIFPDEEPRPYVIRKPKVIISGRVHPGQTPASYCVEGVLRFLLDEKDYRSYLLRKNFHFLIVPMLNPDGVYNGMFRSDMNGDNLNRFYAHCNRVKHPTIWAFREFMLSLDRESPAFYFDFHAHPSKKEFFIYGNAFQEITQQVEAETFGKLLEHNCPYFHNIDSIFSEKQMHARDRNDSETKQGCGRVYMHKLFNMIHSYTVECGYFSPGKLNPLIDIDPKRINSGEYCYVNTWENCSQKIYKPQSYMLMGKSILITILDVFHLNPYTRINLTEYRSIGNIRKAMATKIYNFTERFRLIDGKCPKKMRQLTNLIQENYYKARFGKYGLSVSENYGMQHAKRTFSLSSRLYMPKRFISQEGKKRSQSKSLEKEEEQEEKHEKRQKSLHFENPFLSNVKDDFTEIEQKPTFRHYKSEKKLQHRKHEDLYQLCRVDKSTNLESMVLQGQNPKKFKSQEKMEEELVKKKILVDHEPEFRKSRLDNFLRREAKNNDLMNKKYLPTIHRKLAMEKTTIGKTKDPASVLPSLILDKPKKY